MSRLRERYEYRINKKGAECFRTDSYMEAKAKLEELRSKKPAVKYDMQRRSVRVNRVDTPDIDWLGRPAWSPWTYVDTGHASQKADTIEDIL